jgi:hypothetical protein
MPSIWPRFGYSNSGLQTVPLLKAGGRRKRGDVGCCEESVSDTNGNLWTRTIGSAIVGEGVDSLTFYPIAFMGIWENQTILKVIAFNWFMKVTVEVLLAPVTYAVVGFLKRREDADTYDTHTHFNPFSLKDEGDVREFR